MSYRSIFTGLAVVAAAALPADDVPFVWDSWFNEDYSGINVSTWADTAGTWTRSAQDGSSIEELNGERYLQVGAAPGDLRFSAPTSSGHLVEGAVAEGDISIASVPGVRQLSKSLIDIVLENLLVRTTVDPTVAAARRDHHVSRTVVEVVQDLVELRKVRNRVGHIQGCDAVDIDKFRVGISLNADECALRVLIKETFTPRSKHDNDCK